jgi:hypothetical protein
VLSCRQHISLCFLCDVLLKPPFASSVGGQQVLLPCVLSRAADIARCNVTSADPSSKCDVHDIRLGLHRAKITCLRQHTVVLGLQLVLVTWANLQLVFPSVCVSALQLELGLSSDVLGKRDTPAARHYSMRTPPLSCLP